MSESSMEGSLQTSFWSGLFVLNVCLGVVPRRVLRASEPGVLEGGEHTVRIAWNEQANAEV